MRRENWRLCRSISTKLDACSPQRAGQARPLRGSCHLRRTGHQSETGRDSSPWPVLVAANWPRSNNPAKWAYHCTHFGSRWRSTPRGTDLRPMGESLSLPDGVLTLCRVHHTSGRCASPTHHQGRRSSSRGSPDVPQAVRMPIKSGSELTDVYRRRWRLAGPVAVTYWVPGVLGTVGQIVGTLQGR